MNLDKFQYLYERVQAGVDVHPSELELLEMEELVKEIDPNVEFSWRGCQSCVNDMVKFLFQNQ